MIWRLAGLFAACAGVVALVLYFNGRNTVETAGGGNALADVKVPELSVAEKAGEAAFVKNCSSCHGINAAGKDGSAPPLVHRIYEPGHHGDMAFVLAAKQGVRQHHWPFGNMPPVEGIADGEIEKIVTYVRALQRANGIN